MTTLDTMIQKNQAMQARPDWFEIFLPVSVIPLILILVLILPIFLLTAESLLAPVYDFVRSLLMPVNAGITYTSLPLVLILKIALFSLFTFTGVGLLCLKIVCIYHEVWSHFFYQAHPKHALYHPDQQESMIALFNWNVFRWYRILGPVLGWLGTTILVGTLGLWFFNSFTDFGFLSFQIQFTLGFFLMSVLGFFTAIAAVKGLWEIVTTMLGDVAAITEPEKPAQIIYERAHKLAFGSPMVLFLYPLYFLFYLAIIAEVILLIVQFDIQDILSFNPDILLILGIEVLTIVVFLILNAMKFMAYHHGLNRYYRYHLA